MLLINKFSPTPIYLQIVSQFEDLIFAEILKVEERLPSVRVLAKELAINPNTLQRAYTEMENKRLCISVPGSGRYVTKDAKDIIVKEKKENLIGIKDIIKDAKKSGIPLKDIMKMIEDIYKEV